MKLLRIIDSPVSGKEYRAVFETDDGKIRHTDFGDPNLQQYTEHGDKERRERYRARHRKDLETNDPTRAGFLSYYILWGDSKSMNENILAYKKKFNL
jgi:hypothetical protein